jgi:hypothetical protein
MIEKGAVYTFSGFICCYDEQSILLRTPEDSEESFSYEQFLNHFRVKKPNIKKTG